MRPSSRVLPFAVLLALQSICVGMPFQDPENDHVLATRTMRFEGRPDGDVHRLELRSDGRLTLRQPTEGLWSIATTWEADWPTGWHHASPTHIERKGPWLIASGTVRTETGDWSVRDAYVLEGETVRCVRRWQWMGTEVARHVTLSVRWQAPVANEPVTLPGFCIYGNPSGARDRVPKFHGVPGEELFCEEHRLAMPFASLEWEHDGRGIAAALHTLPSRIPFASHADAWWSMGVRSTETATELALLSGPVSLNGRRGFVKAHQARWYRYPDTWLDVPPKAIIEKTFHLQSQPLTQRGSGFRAPLRAALAIHAPFDTAGLPSAASILAAKTRFARSRWHADDTSAGFDMYPNHHEYVMGWCGQAAAPGYAFLVLADELGDPELVALAQRSLDHLATAPVDANGFPVRYDPERHTWSGSDPVSQGQAMENLARAVIAGRTRANVVTATWEAFLRRACDAHAARLLAPDWRPRSTNEAFLVSPLCKAWTLFGDRTHLDAALAAASHYAARHLSMQEPYWGGTLDASCEDKEGAWAAFQAFLATYEATGERRYLDWAEHAMDATLLYTFVWDVDMPPGRLRDHALKTRGWTCVSAQNQHLDVYGVLYAPELWRMGALLEREDLKRLAIVMYRTCGQMLDPDGSQGEQLNHTNFVQGMPDVQNVLAMRGTYREDWTVFWMTAHFLSAAARFHELGVRLDG